MELIESARCIIKVKSKSYNSFNTIRRRAFKTIKEYDFYSLVAEIMERERMISSLEKTAKIHPEDLTYIQKTLYGVLSLFGYNRIRAIETQIGYHVITILSEIECIIQDSHCNKLDFEARENYHLKWKYYVSKARGLDVKF